MSPIIFSVESVRAILAGRKSQTRRVITHRRLCRACIHEGTPHNGEQAIVGDGRPYLRVGYCEHNDVPGERICSPWAVGDLLWVRETFYAPATGSIVYAADRKKVACRWRSPIHMPRWASRLALEVVAVRVERLQEITEEDALAEGIELGTVATVANANSAVPSVTHRQAFRVLWDSINAKRGYPWDMNPPVRVTSFRVSP